MARKKDGAKESANRRRVAEDVARIRSAGIPVLAKDIAESLSMSTVTVGKHLRALGLSFHGPMGWYGPDEGEYSAWTRAPNAGAPRVPRSMGPWPRQTIRLSSAAASGSGRRPDAERVIEDMGDQAEEFVEDGGDLWLGCSVPKEAVDDLQRRLQDAVDGWLGDNGFSRPCSAS